MFNNSPDTPDNVNEPTPRRSHRWQCPECTNGITLHVRVDEPPVCHGRTSHSRRQIHMKRQKKGNQQ